MSQTIKVKAMNNNRTMEFTINPADKIGTLKPKIEAKLQIPPAQQRLILNGRPVDDERSFTEQNIQPGAVIYLVLQLRGGSS